MPPLTVPYTNVYGDRKQGNSTGNLAFAAGCRRPSIVLLVDVMKPQDGKDENNRTMCGGGVVVFGSSSM
jgi:hypothetical protein